MHRNRWLSGALVTAGFSIAGCNSAEQLVASSDNAPAKVVTVEGSDVARVTLTTRAVERLGIRTQPVTAYPGAGGRTAIPYAAVLYDENGRIWTFTSPAPQTYIRARIVIASVDGELAVLRSGPAPGTPVVSVGAAELLGAELGVGGE